MRLSTPLALLFLTLVSVVHAQQDTANKACWLFNKVPDTLMRDFATDRPDVTESAYTVNAGHFQYEADLFKSVNTRFDGTKNVQQLFNNCTLKAGITNSLDFQLVIESFVHEKTTVGNQVSETSGFGHISLRAKQNIWGNDRGKTALSILPFINLPKGSDEKISGGVVFPFAASLPNNWGFGAQLEFDFNNNQDSEGYHINYLASATISRTLSERFDFFTEAVVSRETETNINEYFINGGLVFQCTKRLNLDSGIYYGLKNASAKTWFIGASYRY